jgi:hypothetical protein
VLNFDEILERNYKTLQITQMSGIKSIISAES